MAYRMPNDYLLSFRCLRVLEGHRDAVRVIASHGSERLFSGSYDSNVCVWDVV